MGRNLKEYALYKGENLLSIGTVNEIAEEIGVKPSTVHYFHTPAYKNRRGAGTNRKVLVELDDDESEMTYDDILKANDDWLNSEPI